ncbi:lamin tail domain-containing protein, partial [Pseudomonas aeruginosa]|uniref:lamin tail domain-containing protein n=1 Tax=Pseudomonas aeruginosa TaxID=287 RepID=UPI002F95F389
LFDPAGALVDDTLPWQGHAAIDGDAAAATLARCPDGVGAFVLARPTPGAANECVLPDVVINEVESNGDATDWVEIVNNESAPVDISGWT